MSPKELKKLVKQLKAAGITHYKTPELELNFAPSEVAQPKAEVKPEAAPVAEKQITPEEEKEIKHKIEELSSVMKLDDVSLLDRLFPDTQPSDEAS